MYTDLVSNNSVFNSEIDGYKDGIWVIYNPSNYVEAIKYYENKKIYLVAFFRKNGSIKAIDWYENGTKREFGNWHYDKKGKILNQSPDF
ncbi:hypothetical protein [Hymenobacter psychrophilus]|uniref:MORN repeat variant n=1 Tax=Hymenobacter psychrophilus TaxID=651662 RepID=A0A1H3LID6_9BACT|nr:hypothetical protein [Hymenobacter psychrophilus]SDY64161.1 hypothetical protein SAMN04488069_1112 [Hymenobacter psychrophilus]